ncbi:RNA 2',3'-cyclic phosphodiesterase [Candidatus Nitrosotenuis sp. DW1]|uniref:RNA 2',3'-cyclic phosphodiesterase n=1 Tax=Candidatus Nitrosotenuis sp. DW1 TaxID=2259672 RepID=UPI0015C9BBCB|nr:RNA 2',3'-cyclic phosphodiesterase [Candidatus Nitrosotenuis sp. DW1]QLH09820.1 RNA 2',3'-cyclic phosphodiesterase [Candidatus Nitrosotenuis sp. DW1]
MRTFVAVEITDQNILNLIKNLQSDLRIDAKPVESQNMHFTLLFLGEISDDMAQRVQNELKTIQFDSFDISFEGVGAFPKPKFPRVVWIGVKDGAEELVELAKTVEKKLAPLGFKSDKEFKPHITVLRIKNKIGDITDELVKYSNEKFGSQKISEIKFKKSILTPSGPIYSDLQEIKASR